MSECDSEWLYLRLLNYLSPAASALIYQPVYLQTHLSGDTPPYPSLVLLVAIGA